MFFNDNKGDIQMNVTKFLLASASVLFLVNQPAFSMNNGGEFSQDPSENPPLVTVAAQLEESEEGLTRQDAKSSLSVSSLPVVSTNERDDLPEILRYVPSTGGSFDQEELIVCVHGGKKTYLEGWLSGSQAGYDLQKILDLPEGLPQETKGTQVYPLYRSTGELLCESANYKRTCTYACRQVSGFTISRNQQMSREEADVMAANINEDCTQPVIMYLLCPAGCIQRAPGSLEAGIPDIYRDRIQSVFLTPANPFLDTYEAYLTPDQLRKQFKPVSDIVTASKGE